MRELLSVVVPLYNETGSLEELYEQLRGVLEGLQLDFEVIFVDDGSRDDSFAVVAKLVERDNRVRGIQLSRNFGHQLAISAGLDAARGDAVVVMDADLQHPPATVAAFVAKWRDGYDVVYGVMVGRQSPRLSKRLLSAAYYRLLRRLTPIDVPLGAGDFRLIDRKAVDVVNQMRERNRYLRGMVSWIGFEQTGVDYTVGERYAGRSSYSLGRMVRFARDGIFSFSDLPLRLILNVGFIVSFLSIAFGVSAIAARATDALTVPGWASLAVAVSFIGGLQLIVLGMVGEYVGRIYDEVKQRPLYVINSLVGFSPRDPETSTRGPDHACG